MAITQEEVESCELWKCEKCNNEEVKTNIPKFMPALMCSECGGDVKRIKMHGLVLIEIKDSIPEGTEIWFSVDQWQRLKLSGFKRISIEKHSVLPRGPKIKGNEYYKIEVSKNISVR